MSRRFFSLIPSNKISLFVLCIVGAVGIMVWQMGSVQSESYEERLSKAMKIMQGLESRSIPIALTDNQLEFLESVYQDSLVRLPNVQDFRNTDKNKLVDKLAAAGVVGNGVNQLTVLGEAVVSLSTEKVDTFGTGIDGALGALNNPNATVTKQLKKLAQSVNTITNDIRLTLLYISWYEGIRGTLCTTDDANNDIYIVGSVQLRYGNTSSFADVCNVNGITLTQHKCLLGAYKPSTTGYITTTQCVNGCSSGACLKQEQRGFEITGADTTSVGVDYSFTVKALNSAGTIETGYTGTFFVILAGDDEAEFPTGALKTAIGTGMKTIMLKFAQEGVMTIIVRSADGREISKTVVVGSTCDNSTACNYGTFGACEYTSCNNGTTCQDSTACNYGTFGACDYSSCNNGTTCQDSTACNYGSSGDCDYSSCNNGTTGTDNGTTGTNNGVTCVNNNKDATCSDGSSGEIQNNYCGEDRDNGEYQFYTCGNKTCTNQEVMCTESSTTGIDNGASTCISDRAQAVCQTKGGVIPGNDIVTTACEINDGASYREWKCGEYECSNYAHICVTKIPVCGNNVQENPEACDGKDNGACVAVFGEVCASDCKCRKKPE